MTLWLIRAGSRGEHEQKCLDEGRSYVAWEGLNVDLASLPKDSLSCGSHLSY
jgi:restriction system protein